MASTSGFNQTDTNDGSSSYFQKTVCLHDWWLIKAGKDFEGKRLAVAGFTSREQQAVRVFSTAPIVNRYDVFTLETADGICVLLKGFINKLRTNDNGFPSTVFSRFVFGFPPDWEECAAKFLEGDSSTDVLSGSIPDSEEFAAHPEIVAGEKTVTPSSEQIPKNHKQVIHEDKHDIEASKGCSHNARLRNLKSNPKNDPESRCSVKHKNKRLSPISKTFEIPDGAELKSSSGTTNQSKGKIDISDNFPDHSMGQMLEKLSVNLQRKQKEEKWAVNGSKGKRNKMNSVPLVSDDVSNILQNNSSEFEGIDISSPSADEVQEPLHENTIRKEDVEHVGDSPGQNSATKHALDCGNIMTQGGMQSRKNNSARSRIGRVNKNPTKDLKNAVDEGESDAKEQSTSRKKIFIVSPESLSFGRSRENTSADLAILAQSTASL
ncbi:kinetochore-associated protein KNL-2 homolog isoform X2 [Corylus avellana]|uniref:kinetochore-associated protein KNL-2 homolog isoform X2 n=1 Tax=Corylus avellana TaxID=13451 RepID=UPI00286B9465|nr:kinetochore-associated protein KNL-2 homolog isoform X2 [Corylus avellana]